MEEFKITMLGPRGVGKTSLLTAMYEQFDANIGRTNLQLTPDLESSAILQERLGELESLLDDFEARGGVGATEAPVGPESLRSFIFGLGKKGKPPSFQLNFRDYPGKYHSRQANLEERKFIRNLLVECIAVIIAIDAPALIENQGKWHKEINRPQEITDLFKNSYQNLTTSKLVIFAPVRCEKYMKDEKTAKELLKNIKSGYAKLLDLLAVESLQSKIAIVVTPVETVGSVIFSRIELHNKQPHFYFRKTSYDAGYNPQYSEQPLRYLLRFLLRQYLDSQNWGIFNFIRDLFEVDEEFKIAIKEFAKGCKNSDGFAVLQGENLLNLE